ncbi:MAG: hypothetical protein V1921_05655 [Candidatus Altiarchaeota archaeon]
MMAEKKFITENKFSILFTAILAASVSGVLYTQGYFTQDVGVSPRLFSEAGFKLSFDDGDPELLAYIPPSRLAGYQTLMGSPVPEDDSMVLGFEEAKSMTDGKNVTTSDILWGYVLEGFLGQDMRVSGMLKKTDSAVDMMHILSSEKFNQFDGEQIDVRLTDEKMPKFFYYVKSENANWPANVTFAEGGLQEFKSQTMNKTVATFNVGHLNLQVTENRNYLPLILGATEADMMREEKLFANVGDRLNGFFGADAVVVGVLEPTDTFLDMLHYMPVAED